MKILNIVAASLVIVLSIGCKKGFLDVSPDKALLVPETPAELLALLNNQSIMNTSSYLHLVASDDFYLTDAGFTSSILSVQNSYLWAGDIYQGQVVFDWDQHYQQIFYSNIVLEGLEALESSTPGSELTAIKGTAHFFRGWALFQLSQQFANPYNSATANTEPGLPVPLASDVNKRPGRGKLQQLYDQILADLIIALELVPPQVSFKNLPDRQVVNGILAKVYLQMNNYERAGYYADQCLKIPHKLVDYNTVNGTPARPFVPATFNGNPEVLFQNGMVGNTFTLASNTRTLVDSLLYRSYSMNDLRKTLFFIDRGAGVVNFRGTYSSPTFSGLAVDEVYLIRAECHARAGNANLALADLNNLMINRFKKNLFVPYNASNAEEALKLVLQERRKELVSRGTRWGDLRRLNQDSRFPTTLKRVIKNISYELPPMHKKYTFPIPDNEIENSGIGQNPR